MKLSKLFFMAAMGLGLAACTENDLVEGGDSNGAQNEGTTYVGFSLKFNASNTRVTTTGEENGTTAEQNIKTAYVVMTNTDGSTIEEVVALTNAKDGTESNVDKKCYVFQTTPGTHYFYAVVNPDEVPAKDGKISDYFNTGVALTVANIASTTDDGNFMMSSENVLNAYLEDDVTEADALAGKKNSFEISVERVAAKVTMTCEHTALANANNNAGGTITTPKFTLKGGATMSYRMAQSAINEITRNAWTNTSSSTDVYVKQEADDGDNYIYRKATPVYCLENLHATGAYKGGNTTYLTLQTTFTPAKVVDCADEIKELKENSATGTFYVVKQGKLAGNYLMAADLQSYRDSKSDQSALPAGVESISEAYTNGTCWFGPIYIGQTDTNLDDAPIYRNTWYNLKITGITLPGDPDEPTPDSEQPLVPGTNVAITLSVMPWNFINREIGLQ